MRSRRKGRRAARNERGAASGRSAADRGAFPAQYAELIERIFRGTHILVTLNRDELIREVRGGEADEPIKSTGELQESLLDRGQN